MAGLRNFPYFLGSDKVYQSSIQSGNSIESYFVYIRVQAPSDTQSVKKFMLFFIYWGQNQ